MSRLVTLNELRYILYSTDNLILPGAIGKPNQPAFLQNIFPERLLKHTSGAFYAPNYWQSSSRRSKLMNGDSVPEFTKHIVELLDRDTEIIRDIYRKWNRIWSENDGDLSIFRNQLMKNNYETPTFIDANILGDKLSKIIMKSEDAAQVLTLVSLFALLGPEINAIRFDWNRLCTTISGTEPGADFANREGQILVPPSQGILQYQIGELIGQGAHSTVYKAMLLPEDKPYAISFYSQFALSDCALFSNTFLQMTLKHEISHSSISRVYGIFAEPRRNLYYVIQEYVPGHTLTVESKFGNSRKMITYLYQILGALEYLHSQNIIHGDITANNIMIDSENNRAKIIDFSDMNMSGNACTSTTALLNEDVFYSPEKLQNQTADFRTDVFSVGALLKYLLSNIHDREGITTDMVLKLYAVIEKATQRAPQDRYQSLSAFIQDLNVALGFSPSQTTDEVLDFINAHPAAFDVPDKPTYSLTRMSTKETISLPISGGLYFIGTDSNKCNYVVDNQSVAPIHCRLTIHETTGVTINDMNSANGSWINERKLIPGHSYPIANNDVLQLADEIFLFRQSHTL